MPGSTTVSTLTRSQSLIWTTPSTFVLWVTPLMRRSGRCTTSPPSTVAGAAALFTGM